MVLTILSVSAVILIFSHNKQKMNKNRLVIHNATFGRLNLQLLLSNRCIINSSLNGKKIRLYTLLKNLWFLIVGPFSWHLTDAYFYAMLS